MIEIIVTDAADVPSSIVLLDLSQTHSGKATPTDSNVERGSDVTDHIKVDLRPFTATCFVGNSMLEAAASDMDGATSATSTVDAGSASFTVNGISQYTDRVRIVYRRLLDLQSAGTLVTIVTGLERYESMCITDLSFPVTNKDGIEFELSAREVRIAETRSAAAPTPVHVRGRRRVNAGVTPTFRVDQNLSPEATPPAAVPTRSAAAELLGSLFGGG
jgi:hypothetical protein